MTPKILRTAEITLYAITFIMALALVMVIGATTNRLLACSTATILATCFMAGQHRGMRLFQKDLDDRVKESLKKTIESLEARKTQ